MAHLRLSWLTPASFVLAGWLAAPSAHPPAPVEPPAQDRTSPRPDQALLAVAWMQHAAERAALCRQVFAAAHARLDAVLADPTATAALEQAGQRDLGRLPPAVVVDIDETILDNAPYNERLVREGKTYHPDTWSAWVQERRAHAIPGAVAFLSAAAARGLVVVYVTNRSAADEEATRENLGRLGLPLLDGGDFDAVLTKGEQPDWGSDKRTRREHVARTHRIAMLVGDDLGDFLSGVRPSKTLRAGDAPEAVQAHGRDLLQERLARTSDLAERFGACWFLLPNPMYGSWLETWEAAHAGGT